MVEHTILMRRQVPNIIFLFSGLRDNSLISMLSRPKVDKYGAQNETYIED